jgi:hypothetical protein
LRREDKLVIYCIKKGINEFLNGGFIGTQEVLDEVQYDTDSFPTPWNYTVNIRPIIYSLHNQLSLAEVRSWADKSRKLELALRNFQRRGGLIAIEKRDFKKFAKRLLRLSKRVD